VIGAVCFADDKRIMIEAAYRASLASVYKNALRTHPGNQRRKVQKTQYCHYGLWWREYHFKRAGEI
jgi:hypothetical protein